MANAPGDIRAIVEEGGTAEALIAIAQRQNCDPIVAGRTGAESLSRILWGSTVNRLLRVLATPVPVAHDKSTGPIATSW